AVIDRSSWEVPALFRMLAGLGGVPEEDQWDTWNMGIGLVAIVPDADVDAVRAAVPEATLLGHVEPERSRERRIRFT
ncbi:MAG: phosphoribosylformylglycinamidine cyclo-ligase, partial [Chloroflexota bacterium]